MATLYDQRVTADQAPAGIMPQMLSLTYQQRQRNRLAVMLPNGKAAAIVLPRGDFLAPGDVLLSASGESIRIEAEKEELLKLTAASPFALLRLVYHLANRHVRAMLTETAVYIEPDPILADMVRQLGGEVEAVSDVFVPESGAYGGGHHHHGEDEVGDRAMGSIGEQLSIAAHQRHP